MAQVPSRPARGAATVVCQALESLQQAGVTHLPKSRKRAPAAASAATPPATPPESPARQPARSPAVPSAAKVAQPAPRAAVAVGDRQAALNVIREEVAACRLCQELADTRTQTVFGVGNIRPRLVFMGEAPGADEDRQGEPFVGRAGQLLNKIIEACTMRREDVYILNTLKCRPPGNRNPLPHEAANCRGFLDRQLAILQPEYICCLGAVAAQNLLGTAETIGRLRGRFHDYQGFRVLCTYHPAYLLRNPPAKKDCWQDMQILLTAMGIKLPGRAE